jgi:hypothetical protein
VIAVPVSDVERAAGFSVDQVGFKLDVESSRNTAFRFVQLNPTDSSCSIQIGNELTDAPVGAGDGGFAPGIEPTCGDHASFANFSDLDGNSWVLQEPGYQTD